MDALAYCCDSAEKEDIGYGQEGEECILLAVEDFRVKVLTQRRELFRQAAQTEEDLLWLEADVEREVEERGQTETMVQLLGWMNGPRGELKRSTVRARESRPARTDFARAAAKTSRWLDYRPSPGIDLSGLQRGG